MSFWHIFKKPLTRKENLAGVFGETLFFAGLFFGADLLGIPPTRPTKEEKTFKELHPPGTLSYNHRNDHGPEELL